MKKSEALTIICNVLLEFSGKRVTNGDTAIKILAELETAGMIPPCCSPEEEVETKYYKWEPEDDGI